MKKLIALLLVLSLLFSFTACGKNKGGNNGDENISNNEQNQQQTATPTVVVPEYKDYGRGTLDFDKLIYSRPNMQALINLLDETTAAVTANETTVEEQIASIRELEAPISTLKTMYSLTNIYTKKDSSVEYWQSEYAYISTSYPLISQGVEDLLVACARSEHRETFENSYFGYSLEEYVDGGIYTDEVVALMTEEARLESEYTSLSTANVEITYNGVSANMRWSGTVDEVTAKAREHFKNDDASYERCLLAIDVLYKNARLAIEKPLLVELIKIRRLIADELGYSSYSELAYEKQGYDYSPAEMLALLKDIGQYAAPVANDLEYTVFQSYFATNVQPRVNSVTLINTLYKAYSELGGNYKDAYSYMLQHGLYDVSAASGNRFRGAFTTYIDDNSSPYLFVTAEGFIADYNTLAHEFGHFLDGYVNNDIDDSVAVAEISSQALELLTLTRLKKFIGSQNYAYLDRYTMFNFLNASLLTQSFYAAFEHMAYELEYDEITETRLSRIIEEAFSLVFGEDMEINGDLSYVTITHTFVAPFYVESYVTASIVSLDIFFTESANSGDGFAKYNALLERGDGELGFTQRLEAADLDSPFDSGKVRYIADSIYFRIVGKHYYKNADQNISAA